MTAIEWTDQTWNPVTGCTKVSPGCKNCYAEGVAKRFWATQYPQQQDVQRGRRDSVFRPRRFTDVLCHPDRLEQPLHWRKPRRVFVNSMSDLFHEDVSDAFIDQVFAVMALASTHTFQILTKRAERMRGYLLNPQRRVWVGTVRHDYQRAIEAAWSKAQLCVAYAKSGDEWDRIESAWPLPNVWLGVSVENQATADARIPLLLQTPAAVRFLSCEPLLGPVDVTGGPWWDWRYTYAYWKTAHPDCGPPIDWVIVGGESGPKARPCNVADVKGIVSQCQAAGVPVFVKQLGTTAYAVVDECEHDLLKMSDRKGGNPSEWPEDLRVREFPA